MIACVTHLQTVPRTTPKSVDRTVTLSNPSHDYRISLFKAQRDGDRPWLV